MLNGNPRHFLDIREALDYLTVHLGRVSVFNADGTLRMSSSIGRCDKNGDPYDNNCPTCGQELDEGETIAVNWIGIAEYLGYDPDEIEKVRRLELPRYRDT